MPNKLNLFTARARILLHHRVSKGGRVNKPDEVAAVDAAISFLLSLPKSELARLRQEYQEGE